MSDQIKTNFKESSKTEINIIKINNKIERINKILNNLNVKTKIENFRSENCNDVKNALNIYVDKISDLNKTFLNYFNQIKLLNNENSVKFNKVKSK